MFFLYIDFNTALKDETVTNLNEVTYAVVIKRRKRNGLYCLHILFFAVSKNSYGFISYIFALLGGNAENPSDQDTYTPYENRKNGTFCCRVTVLNWPGLSVVNTLTFAI